MSHPSGAIWRKIRSKEMQGYIGALPYDLGCAILRNLPLGQVVDLYRREEWRQPIEACGHIFANRQEAVYISLADLLAWPWTRQIKYVLTTFPVDRRSWSRAIEALREQPVLAVDFPLPQREPRRGDAPNRSLAADLTRMFNPLPGTKRVALAGRASEGFFAFSATERYENRRITVGSIDPGRGTEVEENNRLVPLGLFIVLNTWSYNMFASLDLGLSDPSRPPAVDNPPLRDVLMVFWTYVAEFRGMYDIAAYMGNIRMKRGEEGNWIWMASYMEKIHTHEEVDLSDIADYFRRFGVEPSRRMVALAYLGPRAESSELRDSFDFANIEGPLEAMSAEIARPYPGMNFTQIMGREEEILSKTLAAYVEQDYIYMVDGLRVANTEIDTPAYLPNYYM